MGRWVVPKTTGLKAAAATAPDGPATRIAKYVPAEVVAAFTALTTAFASATGQNGEQAQRAAMFLIVFFLIVTVVYIVRSTTGAVRTAHLIVSPAAFIAWAYPISGTMLGDWYVPLYALVAQTIVIGLSIMIQPSTPGTP